MSDDVDAANVQSLLLILCSIFGQAKSWDSLCDLTNHRNLAFSDENKAKMSDEVGSLWSKNRRIGWMEQSEGSQWNFLLLIEWKYPTNTRYYFKILMENDFSWALLFLYLLFIILHWNFFFLSISKRLMMMMEMNKKYENRSTDLKIWRNLSSLLNFHLRTDTSEPLKSTTIQVSHFFFFIET